MSYVSSGGFRADVEAATGNPISAEPDDESEPLASFPPALRTELEALRALGRKWSLCVLTPGDFCSVPALYGEPRDVVLDDWFDGDEVATDFVMQAIDIVNGGGGFYIVIHPDGRMGLVCEDPYSFDPLACNLDQFLRVLVTAHRAVTTSGIDAAKTALREAVDDGTAKLLLTFAERLAPSAT